MKHLFVAYEIARQLKDKGFNEPCLYAYKKTPEHLIKKEGEFCLRCNGNPFGSFDNGSNYNAKDKLVSAPLYQQVIDWFREKHNIHIIIVSGESGLPKYDFCVMRNNNNYKQYNSDFDYYEALTKAIDKALKLLPA